MGKLKLQPVVGMVGVLGGIQVNLQDRDGNGEVNQGQLLGMEPEDPGTILEPVNPCIRIWITQRELDHIEIMFLEEVKTR